MTVGEDTYITVAEADEIISGLLLSADTQRIAWEALSDGDKEVYLRHALAWIETLPFTGAAYDINQTLQFPRDYNVSGEVPAAVKQAQALEAAASVGMLEQIDKRAQLRAQGITHFTAGQLSESYGPVSQFGLLSLQAHRLLRRYTLGGVPF
ncbi:MAG: DnaT-like ssDNA-binding protein [Burkholderiales bacterium]